MSMNPNHQTNPVGINTTIAGLETMAESCDGYRSQLCILEMTIEMNGWFSNVGNCVDNHRRLKTIQNIIVPNITHEPYSVRNRDGERLQPWNVAKDIKENHQHMSIHAAERAAEYWMDQ